MRDVPHLIQSIQSRDESLLSVAVLLAEVVSSYTPTVEGNPPKLYVFGGFVRESALGLTPNDLDTEVYGIDPKEFACLLDWAFPGRWEVMGRSFQAIKLSLDEEKTLDISLPRQCKQKFPGIFQADSTITPSDSMRRVDFTINTVLYDPLSHEIFDPHGGLDDIHHGIIRATDITHFTKAPFQVLRALRLATKLGFIIDQKTEKVMRTMIREGTYEKINPRRFRNELVRILLDGFDVENALRVLGDYKVLEFLFPEYQNALSTVDWYSIDSSFFTNVTETFSSNQSKRHNIRTERALSALIKDIVLILQSLGVETSNIVCYSLIAEQLLVPDFIRGGMQKYFHGEALTKTPSSSTRASQPSPRRRGGLLPRRGK